MNDIKSAITKSIKDLFNEDIEVELTRPGAQFGDFSSNVALQLAKKVNKNPREVAESLVQKLIENSSVEKAEIAGPGFINIYLTNQALLGLTSQSYTKKREGETVVIETNNPNPFKAMHIGHALNAILADTLANIIEHSGAQTHRVSYHGDVGLHVGKSMWALLRYIEGNPTKLQGIEPAKRNSFMSQMYSDGAKAYEDHKEEIDQLASQSFVLDDPRYREVYDTCKDWSFAQIDDLVMRLGNKPIEKRYLESEADSLGVKTVKAHIGDVFKESDGAIIFEGSKYGSFDNAFVKANGRGLYGARDLGLMQLKNSDFQSKKSYIVTAEEQKDYFKGVIKAAELCLPELKDVTVNIPTGTVKLTSGKMSSRDGNIVEIEWLLEQISDAIKERSGEENKAIEAGALRYQFLKVKIGSDVVFDINEAVNIVGNSGPYLQYAHARGCSILAKSTVDPNEAYDTEINDSERLLMRKIGEYTEVIEHATRELAPHYICTYLYELSQEFNRFYEKNRVIGGENEANRLKLVSDYVNTLKQGLGILGIDAPEHV